MNKQSNRLLDTVTMVAASLCRYPALLEVVFVQGVRPVVTLKPHRADYGLICGTKGDTIRAINVIAKALEQGATVELVEGDIGEKECPTRFSVDLQWTKEALEDRVRGLLAELFPGKMNFDYEPIGRGTTKMTALVTGKQIDPVLTYALAQIVLCWSSAEGQKVILEIVGVE